MYMVIISKEGFTKFVISMTLGERFLVFSGVAILIIYCKIILYSGAKCRQTEYMIMMNKEGFVLILISLHQELELLC